MSQSNNNSTGISLQQENQSLRRTILELSILNDIAAAISSAQSVSEIERLIVKKCIKHLMAEEGIIMLLNEADESGAFTTMLRTRNSIMDSLPYKLDDQIMGWMLKNKTALVINNLNEDKRFTTGNSPASQIRSLVCVPMFVKSRMIGVLTLFNKIKASFTDDDKRLRACMSKNLFLKHYTKR